MTNATQKRWSIRLLHLLLIQGKIHAIHMLHRRIIGMNSVKQPTRPYNDLSSYARVSYLSIGFIGNQIGDWKQKITLIEEYSYIDGARRYFSVEDISLPNIVQQSIEHAKTLQDFKPFIWPQAQIIAVKPLQSPEILGTDCCPIYHSTPDAWKYACMEVHRLKKQAKRPLDPAGEWVMQNIHKQSQEMLEFLSSNHERMEILQS